MLGFSGGRSKPYIDMDWADHGGYHQEHNNCSYCWWENSDL